MLSLAKLEAEALAGPWAPRTAHMEVLPPAPHARMPPSSSSHTGMAPHAPAAEECLENAVGVDIVEAGSAAAALLNVLPAVVHPPLLLVGQHGVSLPDLGRRSR